MTTAPGVGSVTELVDFTFTLNDICLTATIDTVPTRPIKKNYVLTDVDRTIPLTPEFSVTPEDICNVAITSTFDPILDDILWFNSETQSYQVTQATNLSTLGLNAAGRVF